MSPAGQNSQIGVAGSCVPSTNAKPVDINFSEFEAESDPFEKAELQTLNDLQELAAVLQTTVTNFPTSSSASVYSTPAIHNATSSAMTSVTSNPTASIPGPPRYAYYPPPSNMHHPPNPYYYQPHHPRPAHLPPTYFPYQGMMHGQRPQVSQPPMVPPQGATASGNSEMKSSKSVGDIMAEIKKEAEALEKMKIRGHQRKNSQTPPPRSANLPIQSGNSENISRMSAASKSKILDDWIPWPDIGQTSASRPDDDKAKILSDLNPSGRAICQQISEMGFNLARVVKGYKSLGDDRQKLINFCLLVDKLLNSGSKFTEAEVEYVIPIHNLNEDSSKKHLKAFYRLIELGFDREAIHQALISTQLDHDKALEKLLK